jgi:hypothetical protein
MIRDIDEISGDVLGVAYRILRLTRQPVGLLINFAGAMLKEGCDGLSTTIAPLRPRAAA